MSRPIVRPGPNRTRAFSLPVRRRTGRILGALALAFLFVASAHAVADPAAEVEECLGCHSDPELSTTLPDGEKVSLVVDGAAFARSLHASKIGCTGCHRGFNEVPHRALAAKTREELSAELADACRRCHFDDYSRSLDGVHHAQRAAGNTLAPGCVDCHGSHEILSPARPRRTVSETCSACHDEVFATYAKSVHGKALLEDGNTDVPVCTDCHRSHDIADPKSQRWRLTTPDACGACHADEERMKKYGLSAAVLKTYLADFHGMSAALYRSQSSEPAAVVAVCSDCHGVHDIRGAKDVPPEVLKARLVETCRKCHPGASENFPAAWLSHWEPSPTRAPLVWAVGVFYKIFIPFIIGGLILQILLHLWRVVVNK